MTFSQIEISNAAGQPVILYEFHYGNSYWRYCTGDSLLTAGVDENGDPAEWTPVVISDGGVTQGGSDQNDLTLTAQANLPVAGLFRNKRPSGKVFLTVKRFHIGDPDLDAIVDWVGTVGNAIQTDPATVQMSCRSLAATFDRNGLRLGWGRMCPHVLYGIGCFVDKTEHAYPRTIATLTGNSFTCTSHAEPEEGTFSGGFMEWARDDGSFERLAIDRQVGNNFRVLGATTGLEVGTEITLYPGCARDTTTCKLFDNLPNYGGFPHLPGKSPFDGTPVF